MSLKSLLLPYDVYSRHKIVAQLIHRSGTVLDVGGSLKELQQFLPANITLFTVDVIGGDVLYDGAHLPFKNKSVETVVSIDTMEHIPAQIRPTFISQLAQIAQKRLIIAAPLGTPAHSQAEYQELERQKTRHQKLDHYLVEHVKYGLPTVAQIKSWTKNFPHHNLLFEGNFHTSQRLFRLQQTQINFPKLGKLWYELRKLIFAMINILMFPQEKEVSFSQSVNRFYLQINL